MKDTVLVVPSIRENSWNRFVKEWRSVGLFKEVDVILMEDNPKKTFDIGPAHSDEGSFHHYCWDDIESELDEDSWIIPRRSDTVRSFGYYMAYLGGWKYVLTLDDDCYPPTEEGDGFHYRDGAKGFLQLHREALEGKTRWFNTLTSVKPRGIPFYETGKLGSVVINHGLWTNVLDYDAPTQLVNPIKEKFSFDNRIVPSGQYFPMCGMNVMWKGEATVLMYHLLMGKKTRDRPDESVIYNPSDGDYQLVQLPFDRFGDIWCGIIAKKICDVRGDNISTGIPYIHHDRASNPFANLKKEANGLEVNEVFWKYIDKYPGVGKFTWAEHYDEMGAHVGKFDEFPQYSEYFGRLGSAMRKWAAMFWERK